MIELPVIDVKEDADESSRTRFWRSVSDLKNDAEFRKIAGEEFLPGASDGPSGASRRQFLQVMGASMALAGLTACRRPVEKILPFSRRPEELIPGVPLNYASAMPFRGTLRGLLVESTDGRPTKIEGNPDHMGSRGATTVFEQAALLSLYDPDRSGTVLNDGTPSSWLQFSAYASALPREARVAVICEPDSSMSLASLREQLSARFASVQWVEYSATGDNTFAAAAKSVFGRTLRPRYDFVDASVIVSLDADFLAATDRDSIWNTGSFSAGRNAEAGDPNRLYAIESQFSITGGMADNRLRLRSDEIPAFAAALATELGVSVAGGESYSDHAFIREIAADLRQAGSSGVVMAGENQGADVHAICMAINDSLGAVGTSVKYFEADADSAARVASLQNLVADIRAGNVDVLVVTGANPVHDAPADLDFATAIESVPDTIHLGMYVDETARASTWHLPRTHFLEAWGDGRAYNGMMSVIQPLIAPLYDDAKSELELMVLLATYQNAAGYDIVRETWQEQILETGEDAWKQILHDGFHWGTEFEPVSPGLRRSAVPTSVQGLSGTDYEVVVRLDQTVLDGSFANNAWLQELPDPVTKVVWDNVALMSPATAAALGVENRLTNGRYFADIVSIATGDDSVDLPVWVLPGMADGSIAVTLGYGQDITSIRDERKTNIFDLDDYTDVYGSGAISSGVGSNVAALRSTASMNILSGVSVSVSGSGYMVASTQDHGALQEEAADVAKRGIFRMATVEEFKANPRFVEESEPAPIRENWESYPTLWEQDHATKEDAFRDNNYFRNQWGMVIDLNTCTGCNACVVACQAENNIQVVGKEEVSLGREMHWLRLDRYFVSGDGSNFDSPGMVIQPLPCMHCENAPCEEVCPVAATVHSPDGTNQMIYNRCVGTRYCANNCPYKVRRFNFYNWTKTLPLSVQMTQNPNVTVRSRGVMEKCSYCIQRIREVNKRVNVEDRMIEEGEVVTACQQVCPARAITFGDLSNVDSEVSRKRSSDRRYELLAELNVKPRTSYLGRIRNPNPNLEPEA